MEQVTPVYRAKNEKRLWRGYCLITDPKNANGFLLVEVMDDRDVVYAELDGDVYIPFDDLVALLAEVAVDHNLVAELRATRMKTPIAWALEEVIPEMLGEFTISDPRAYLMVCGQQMIRSERRSIENAWEDRATAYVTLGGDAFPGERQIFRLLESGYAPSPVRIGDKELCFDTTRRQFYVKGPKVWNGREIVTLVLWVLCDEKTQDDYPDQSAPFLTVALRTFRGEISLPVRTSLGALAQQRADDEARTFEAPPAAEAPPTPAAPPNTEPTAQGLTETAPEPDASVLEQVDAAGKAAQPTADEVHTGMPGPREALDRLLQSHRLK